MGFKRPLVRIQSLGPSEYPSGYSEFLFSKSFCDSYKNRDHRLPEAIGRVWYEADFDYARGYRNGCRLLYSNDGLIFVTYDHYLTFHEIGLEATR